MSAGTEGICHGHETGDVIVCRGGNFSIHVGAASDSSGGVVDFFAGDFAECVDGFVLPIYCVVFIVGGVVVGIGNGNDVLIS